MSIYNDFRFNLQGIDDLEIAWEKLEIMFGKHNEILGHQLENELITINLGDNSCIQDYFSMYKTLKLLLDECGIKRKEMK